jgi:hypothetical protein
VVASLKRCSAARYWGVRFAGMESFLLPKIKIIIAGFSQETASTF